MNDFHLLQIISSYNINGAFVLPDTKTGIETETDSDTVKLAQNPMRICVGVFLCEL